MGCQLKVLSGASGGSRRGANEDRRDADDGSVISVGSSSLAPSLKAARAMVAEAQAIERDDFVGFGFSGYCNLCWIWDGVRAGLR